MQAVMDTPMKGRPKNAIFEDAIREIESASPEYFVSVDSPDDLDVLLDFSVEVKRGGPTPLLDGGSCCCSCCSCNTAR
jgi:hypothetical protein